MKVETAKQAALLLANYGGVQCNADLLLTTAPTEKQLARAVQEAHLNVERAMSILQEHFKEPPEWNQQPTEQ